MGELPAWWPSDKPWLISDALEGLKKLPDGVIQCVPTSPPYWGLRDYGVEGQLGLEKTPEEYVRKLVEIFREVKRVLRNDGTCWLNLGDSYAGEPRGTDVDNGTSTLTNGASLRAVNSKKAIKDFREAGLKRKDLVGIPWRVAFALQSDGWYLRSDIIWNKPNPMPESVTDRPTKAHEYVFLLTKSARYYYDNEAVKEIANYDGRKDTMMKGSSKFKDPSFLPSQNGQTFHERGHERWSKDNEGNHVRNCRSVWTITTKPYKGSHFATFPPELPERCIKAGTSLKGACLKCGAAWERVVETVSMPRNEARNHSTEGQRQGKTPCPEPTNGITGPASKTIGWQPTCSCGIQEPAPCIVLDPFLGSGTVLEVARLNNRLGLGFELNPGYEALIQERAMSKIPALEGYFSQIEEESQVSEESEKQEADIYG